ncbi:MAG: hypothetical protein SNJ77_11915, partial [Cytophagales bacterium]
MFTLFKKTIQLLDIALDNKSRAKMVVLILAFFGVTVLDLGAVWLLIHNIFLLESPEKIHQSPVVIFVKDFIKSSSDIQLVYFLFLLLLIVYVLKNTVSHFVVSFQNNTLSNVGSHVVKKQIERYFSKEDFFK